MNIYELTLFIWISILTTIFICLVFNVLDRTKKLKDTLDKLKSYINVDLDAQVKAIRQLVFDEIINKPRCKEDKKIGVGKWIRIESYGTDGTSYWYACSACHNKVPKSEYGIDYFSTYCPACGAKMEFESEVDP